MNPPTLADLRQAVQIRLMDPEQKIDTLEIDAELNRQLDLWTRDNDVVQISLISDILAGSNPQTIVPPGGYQVGRILKALIRQNGVTITDLTIRSPEQMYNEFPDWPDTGSNSSIPLFLILDFDPNTNAHILNQSAWLWPGPNLSLTKDGAKASGTLTVGGTAHAGDVLTATVAGASATYTVTGSDTTATAASSLATNLNANATFNAIYSASASGSVVTVSALTVGSTQNNSLSGAVTGSGATTTLTASGSTLTGGGDPNGGLTIVCKAVTDGLLKQDGDQVPAQAMYCKDELIEATCANLLIRRKEADLAQYHSGEAKRERHISKRAQILGRAGHGGSRCYWN